MVFTAQSRHPVVIVCTWVCGYAFGQTWRQAFARSNEIWLLYSKLTTVFCCLASPCKVTPKVTLHYTATLEQCPLPVTYIKGKIEGLCVGSLRYEFDEVLPDQKQMIFIKAAYEPNLFCTYPPDCNS